MLTDFTLWNSGMPYKFYSEAFLDFALEKVLFKIRHIVLLIYFNHTSTKFIYVFSFLSRFLRFWRFYLPNALKIKKNKLLLWHMAYRGTDLCSSG